MNQTKDEARKRVCAARVSSLANPTMEYMITLRSELYSFIEAVDEAIAKEEIRLADLKRAEET